MFAKRNLFPALLAACGMATGAAFAAVAAPAAVPAADAPHGNWKTVQTYCFECHNVTDWAGGVAFDSMSQDAVPQDAKIWEKAISN